MPVCIISRRNVPRERAIAVHIGDTQVGYISHEAFQQMDEPEYKRAEFRVPDNYDYVTEETED